MLRFGVNIIRALLSEAVGLSKEEVVCLPFPSLSRRHCQGIPQFVKLSFLLRFGMGAGQLQTSGV